MEHRALEPEDLPALRELAMRPDVSCDLDLDVDDLASLLPITPGVKAAIGAFAGNELVCAAGVTAHDRPRLRHTGRCWLVCPPRVPGAARSLLEAITRLTFDWWRLDRLELSLPATSAHHAEVAELLQREVVRRMDFDVDGTLIDTWCYARIRDGLAGSPGVRAFPPRRGAPLPAAFEIRACTPDDAPAFARVLSDPSVIWGTLQSPFVSTGVWRNRLAANDPERDKLFVAVVDGVVVGTAGLHRSVGRRRHVWHLGMTVTGEWQGRGIGAQSMHRLMETADSLGVTRVELNVYADNARAISLYEKFGFEREGEMRIEAWRDGAFTNGIAMARLRPGQRG